MTETKTRRMTKPRLQPVDMPPPLYKVVLMNDDYTPMEFVVEVIQTVFGYDQDRATQIMLQVHYEGHSVCGAYVRDVAETKAQRVMLLAKKAGHPLLCQVEN